MLIMEAAWFYSGDERYYRQLRFWTKIFILTFGIGTASGIPLEFEFGTNWAAFSNSAGDFFGNILGFESTVAFALEAAFLAIFVFGWKRVSRSIHLFSNLMIFVGATLSAFWIMAANSWMQVPIGVAVVNGKMIVTDYVAAILNPDTLISFLHMWVACVETTVFMMAGICAWALLRKSNPPGVRDSAAAESLSSPAVAVESPQSGSFTSHTNFFLDAFRYCLIIALFLTPVQIVLGDISGQTVAQYQPAKLAALELHWQTNPPGEGAAWSVVAWPQAGGGANALDLPVPNVLSLLITHTTTGQVRGLDSFAPNDRPTTAESVVTFYSFRIMVAIGFVLFFLTLAGLWYWYKDRLRGDRILEHKLFWWLWVCSIPLGFVATEAGWMVREIGRQPWVVYHLMRTNEGLSSGLTAAGVASTTAIFTLLYLTFGALFIYFTHRIVKKGPDITSPLPTYEH